VFSKIGRCDDLRYYQFRKQCYSQTSRVGHTSQSADSDGVIHDVGSSFNSLWTSERSKGAGGDKGKDDPKMPNLDQLTNVKEFLIDQFPQILSKAHEYRIYTKDMVFENNWNIQSPRRTVGCTAYAWSIVKARFFVHGRYAKVKIFILNASIDSQKGCVQMRWRISGLPQVRAFMFWKFQPFQFRKKAEVDSEWLDGLSTLYVNNRGFIYRHVLDRVIPDEDKSASVKKSGLDVGGS